MARRSKFYRSRYENGLKQYPMENKRQPKRSFFDRIGVLGRGLFVLIIIIIILPYISSRNQTNNVSSSRRTTSNVENKTTSIEQPTIEADEKTVIDPVKENRFKHSLSEFDKIDTFETDSSVSTTSGGYAKAFFRRALPILLEKHSEFDNGVFFVDKSNATDKYGNHTQINTIIVYLSPETLNKINFDNKNWGKSPSDLYNVADVVNIFEDFETEEFRSKLAGSKDVPNDYYFLIAEGY